MIGSSATLTTKSRRFSMPATASSRQRKTSSASTGNVVNLAAADAIEKVVAEFGDNLAAPKTTTTTTTIDCVIEKSTDGDGIRTTIVSSKLTTTTTSKRSASEAASKKIVASGSEQHRRKSASSSSSSSASHVGGGGNRALGTVMEPPSIFMNSSLPKFNLTLTRLSRGLGVDNGTTSSSSLSSSTTVRGGEGEILIEMVSRVTFLSRSYGLSYEHNSSTFLLIAQILGFFS